MNFKNKLMSKMPFLYISKKVSDKKEAKLIYDGYKAIKRLNLFDDEFYLDKYPKTASMDPLLHYLFFGFEEGKKPNKDFDGAFYVNKYGVDINPLIHYALIGRDKGYSYSVSKNDLSEFKDSSKKSILFMLHEKIGNVGGTGFTSLDIIKCLDDGYKKFILTSDGEDVELWEYDNKLNKLAGWEVEYSNIHALIDLDKSSTIVLEKFEKELFNPQLESIYEEILLKLDIDIVHINHLINHSFDIFNLAIDFNIKYLINIHDFYYCCPSIHLLDRNLNFCNLNCCNNCAVDIDDEKNLSAVVKIWQEHCHNALKNSHLNIVPSLSTLNLYEEFYPDLTNFEVIEHGRNIEKIYKNHPIFPNGKFKILFPGFISQHKGSLLIKSIKELDKKNKLEFHFMGTTIPDIGDCGINHGRYNREDFSNIVNEIKPDFIGIMSVCPETYSHTLTESIATGVPIITTDLGAQKERVERDNIGWIVNHRNPLDIYNSITNIKEEDYIDKVKNISKVKLKTFDEMINQYRRIYEGIE